MLIQVVNSVPTLDFLKYLSSRLSLLKKLKRTQQFVIRLMGRRYRKIDWHGLRSLIESNLNKSVRFSGPVNVKGKIEWIESGLSFDSYRFRITGKSLPKDWQQKPLLLRLLSQRNAEHSKSKSRKYLFREARTLEVLKQTGVRFETPELICMIKYDAEDRMGLIETWVSGIPLYLYKSSIYADRILSTIAKVAATVHQLHVDQFSHLKAVEDSLTHILRELGGLSPELFRAYPTANTAKEWILSNLPEKTSSTVLHGDLLPQNILCVEDRNEWKVAVIDWEYAQIGDPAYDLAIVTRGDRKIFGINHGLALLVDAYREAGGIELSVSDVRKHELLLFLRWLWESTERHRKGNTSGHGTDYYVQRLKSLLRRAEKCS